VGQESPDAAVAPTDPDPDGGRIPEATAHFGDRVGRQALVSNPDTDGLSLTIFRFAPGTVLPRHRHDLDYIEFIVEGEVHHGNRVIGPGGGVYRAAGTPYTYTVGPKGATVADFRAHTWYRTAYVDEPADWPDHRNSDAESAEAGW
jgi:hypothetical protein